MSAGKCRLQLLLDPLSEACWNGQIEGQITKLKPVKRQMYGRARLTCSGHVSSPQAQHKRDPHRD